MVLIDLQGIAEAILEKARNQGYVVPRDIREELQQAGMPPSRWKEVIELAQPSLKYRRGRYYFLSKIRARSRHEVKHHREVRRAARALIRTYKAQSVDVERRDHHRIYFVQPVKVFTADNRELNLLIADISLSGVRLVGAYDLRGQRVRILVPSVDRGGGQWSFVVQMLWSASVGDQLIENGGLFLEINEDSTTS